MTFTNKMELRGLSLSDDPPSLELERTSVWCVWYLIGPSDLKIEDVGGLRDSSASGVSLASRHRRRAGGWRTFRSFRAK